jgi:tRNA pseudouridine38-40 synthase
MTVAYDGTDYRGFALNTGVDVPTVGGALAHTLARLFQVPSLPITCAGRTDRGVHAWGQVISFDAPAERVADADAVANIVRVVNRNHAPTIVARDAAVVDARFDARFSARSRVYRYTIVNRPVPDPFLARTAWHVAAPLDLRAMILGCDPFIGLHEFGSFCRDQRRPTPRRHAQAPDPRCPLGGRRRRDLTFWIRRVRSATRWSARSPGPWRSDGEKRAGDLMGIIAAQDRRAAGDLAPPQGLCLWQVRYE